MKKWEKPELIDLSMKATEYDPNGGEYQDGWWQNMDGTKKVPTYS